MFSKALSRSIVSVLGCAIVLSFCIGIPGAIASDDPPLVCPDECDNNEQFTAKFRLQDCKYFKHIGKNPYFNLIPGFKSSFKTPTEVEDQEEAEITVLWDTKWINLRSQGLGWIKTRVVEERAYEANDDEDLLLTEISLNWFAICKKTNAVYYFGEDSRDCSVERGGFDPDDETKCLLPEPEEDGLLTANEDDEDLEPDTAGSWKAGIDGARPGLIMPGTWLLNAKYFQEWAPKGGEDVDDSACDRGENREMGLTEDDPKGGEFTDCVEVIDTNPVEKQCGEDDPKVYCPGVGLVKDGDLVLTDYGYNYSGYPWYH